MNKKVIAMAIAATMAAPMAAQAEDGLKVSGRTQVEAVSNTTVDYTDFGQGRLVFDYGMGSIVSRVAFDMRTNTKPKGFDFRDYYLGMKVGDGKIMYGQLGGAGKNIEKDPFIATFLELRNGAVAGGSYGSSSFIGAIKTAAVGNIIGYRGKFGDMKVNVDFGSGHTGLGVAGGSWFVAYNTMGGTGTAMKAGMSFGAIKVIYDSTDVAPTASQAAADRITLDYAMEMGGGNMNISYATAGKDGTNAYYRVAYKTKMAGGSVHTGLTMNGGVSNDMQMGVGYMMKF